MGYDLGLRRALTRGATRGDLGVAIKCWRSAFESVFGLFVSSRFWAVLAVFAVSPLFRPLSGGMGENARRALPSRLSLLKRDQAREIVLTLAETEN